jgi:Lon protease-like protein
MKKNDLPENIAIFPLSNAVFFPRTVLPLNIFENRYIQLVSDCMKEKRLFGMIQPKKRSVDKPEVYRVGCLGKIVSFNETNDKKFIITLSGIIRFRIKEELDNKKLYRKFNVDYSDFVNDLKVEKNETTSYDKKNLLNKIKLFFHKINYEIELNELNKLNFDQLISTICMISPFSIEEKQKLIETIKIEDKIKVLEEIINFNLFDLQENNTVQ